MPHAIFLSGPVGAGKSTLGRGLAEALGGGFIDGDDHSDPDRSWYGSILSTSRAVLRSGLAVLAERPSVVIAYPLGCTTWIFYRRRFAEAGVTPIFISLRAQAAAILGPGRGRIFSEAEQRRVAVMVAEGYGARPFSDAVVDTDQAGFDATLAGLVAQTRALMHGRPG